MAQNHLDRLSEPSTLARIGGAAQGGSAKTPRERENMNHTHEGRDKTDAPEASLPPQKPAPKQEHPPQKHPAQVHPEQVHPEQKRIDD
jgi:hypothetical protein